MSVYRVAIASCLLLLSTAGTALAQNDRTVGLVMGVPVQVGLLWHATERVAVRPDVSFNWSSSESSSDSLLSDLGYGGTTSSSSTRVATGVSLLFYLTGAEDLRTYIAPRYSFSRSSSSSSTDLSVPGVPDGLLLTSDSTHTSHSVGGLFGTSYSLGSRFTVFGEIGFDFSTLSSALVGSSTSKSVGTRGGVGVVVYF